MKKLIAAALLLAVIIAAAVLLFKIISGAIGIISGLLNAVLALAIIAATIFIVVWMFRYASRHK